MVADHQRRVVGRVLGDHERAVADRLHDPLPLEVRALGDVHVEQHAHAPQELPLVPAGRVVRLGGEVRAVVVGQAEAAAPARQRPRVGREDARTALAEDAHVPDVDVALRLVRRGLEVGEVRVAPRGRPAEREVAGADPVDAEGADGGGVDVQHRAELAREHQVVREEAGPWLLGADTDRPPQLRTRRHRRVAAQREPLVRRGEHVHAVGRQRRELAVRDARLDARATELVADRFDDLDEERVLARRHHEDDVRHAGHGTSASATVIGDGRGAHKHRGRGA